MAVIPKICSRRKGFVYTLEAIIAATLFLVMATVVIPEAQPPPNREVQRNVHSALGSLDKSGDLRDNLSVSGIENNLSGFIPPGYNYSVKTTEIDTETRTFSSPDEFHFNKTGNHTELQLWLNTANDLNVTFNGEKIVENRSNAGYVEKSLSSSTGFLNFTGTGEGTFDFDTYTKKGSTPEKDNLKSVSYVVADKNLTEVKVFLWLD